MNLLSDVHFDLPLPPVNRKSSLIRGDYKYYHYLCDGINDMGWGCGYRTLQTVCSWIREQQKHLNKVSINEVPTILEIQRALVKIGDKNQSFINSKEWIGSLEVAYVIDHFFGVQCKIIHCRCVDDLTIQVTNIMHHFEEYGSPVMMGGDRDCSSKGVLGICENEDGIYLLILDPHFHGKEINKQELQEKGWVKWQDIKSLDQSSFYNLCCPLIKACT